MSLNYRHETKYLTNACQTAILEARARAVMMPDKNTKEDGSYFVKSLYFDDYANGSYFDIEDGYDRRTKYRIRYYGCDRTYIKLEKKSKLDGMTHKESCMISEEQCKEFMRGRIPVTDAALSEEAKTLFLEMRLKNLVPKVIVIYERIPFVCQAGNVRVTFDKNLASSNDIGSFLGEIRTMRPVLRKGENLLEVKWDELLPGYIYGQLQLDSLQQTNFSKYYLCRKYNCIGGARI